MKAATILRLGLALAAHRAHAQMPAVISAPISEKISRKQITHQTVTGTLMAQGKVLAGEPAVREPEHPAAPGGDRAGTRAPAGGGRACGTR